MMTKGLASFPRPPFVVRQQFLETPFECRFQALLKRAWKERSWHVIAAVPGSGKSLGIADLLHQSGAYKDTTGLTRLPVLAIRAPKNATREQALGMALSATFGVIPSMPWAQRRIWLVQILASTGVECIIIDDAQDLNLSHLALLKELTDNLAAPPYEQRVGLCLVAAHSGNVMPLKETFARPDVLWKQFRHRMALVDPYCIVDGHTEEEVRHILITFEDLYRSQLPDLQLHRWTKTIFTWLINPILDPDGSKRVTMDHLSRLVVTALRRAYENGATDIDAATLQAVAEVMILRRDEITHIDGSSPEQEAG
jgi:AAA domain